MVALALSCALCYSKPGLEIRGGSGRTLAASSDREGRECASCGEAHEGAGEGKGGDLSSLQQETRQGLILIPHHQGMGCWASRGAVLYYRVTAASCITFSRTSSTRQPVVVPNLGHSSFRECFSCR